MAAMFSNGSTGIFVYYCNYIIKSPLTDVVFMMLKDPRINTFAPSPPPGGKRVSDDLQPVAL